MTKEDQAKVVATIELTPRPSLRVVLFEAAVDAEDASKTESFEVDSADSGDVVLDYIATVSHAAIDIDV